RKPDPDLQSRMKNDFTWQAGYGECDITPPKGQTQMAGFGRERHATGAIAPLLCQALALSDGRRKILFLAADILAFDPTTTESVRRTLKHRHGIAPEAVLLAPSHTHWSTPSIYRMNLCVGGIDPWWLKRLEEHLLTAATQALGSMRP